MKLYALPAMAVVALTLVAPPAHAERLVTLTPVPSAMVVQGYDQGQLVLASTAAHSTVQLVAVRIVLTESRRSIFRMTVENRSSAAANVTPQTVGAINDKGIAIPSLTPQDLYRLGEKVIADQVWRHKLVEALTAPDISSTATATTNINVSGYNPYGTTNLYGQATTTVTADPAAVQAALNAKAQRDASFSQSVVEGRGMMQKIANENGLISQTVQPGATYTTSFVIDALPKKTRSVTINIRVGEDIHQFLFSVAE